MIRLALLLLLALPGGQVRDVTSADGVRYRVAWEAPARHVAGTNALVFRLTTRAGRPLRATRFAVLPWMWMGRGDGHATPTEAPRETSPGVWRVPIYYVMPGEWTMAVVVARRGVRPDTVRFAPFLVHDR